jgi:hypothetical protein
MTRADRIAQAGVEILRATEGLSLTNAVAATSGFGFSPEAPRIQP